MKTITVFLSDGETYVFTSGYPLRDVADVMARGVTTRVDGVETIYPAKAITKVEVRDA